MSGRACKDCEPGTKRPAPNPGPRCATHHREVVKARRLAAKEKRVHETYGLTPDEYDAIHDYQGGRCAICQRATGERRRLAVDHDHSCCNGPTSCGRCVRGLLCKSCNTMLGRMRDDASAFDRAASYLRAWPSQRGPVRSAEETGSTEERAA